MKIFLAGGESRHWLLDEMIIYLAGGNGKNKIIARSCENENISCRSSAVERRGGYDKIIANSRPYILESFYYANADTERLIPYYGDFLLDSGAFTFMQNQKKAKVEWDDYIERYADFIKRNKVKKYFELDIDSVVGYEKVLQYRQRLEKLAETRCIPVWHKSRGLQEWRKMCEEYNYVAIGGIVSKEITKQQYPVFATLLNIAHSKGTKVHGLGFTSLDGILKYKFDSVDSTAWTTGNRFGYIYYFDGKTMKKIDTPKGKRLNGKLAAVKNFAEWIRFQQYAETHL